MSSEADQGFGGMSEAVPFQSKILKYAELPLLPVSAQQELSDPRKTKNSAWVFTGAVYGPTGKTI